MENRPEHWREIFGSLRTEPLTIRRFAEFFDVGVRKAEKILSRKRGVEVIGEGKGRRYRVPVMEMPLAYWQQMGLLPPEIWVGNRPK